jgi:hypothetical protein
MPLVRRISEPRGTLVLAGSWAVKAKWRGRPLPPRRKLRYTMLAADVSSSLEKGEPALEAVNEKRSRAVL